MSNLDGYVDVLMIGSGRVNGYVDFNFNFNVNSNCNFNFNFNSNFNFNFNFSCGSSCRSLFTCSFASREDNADPPAVPVQPVQFVVQAMNLRVRSQLHHRTSLNSNSNFNFNFNFSCGSSCRSLFTCSFASREEKAEAAPPAVPPRPAQFVVQAMNLRVQSQLQRRTSLNGNFKFNLNFQLQLQHVSSNYSLLPQLLALCRTAMAAEPAHLRKCPPSN